MLVRRVLTWSQALPVLVIAIYSYCAFCFGLFSFALSFFSVFKLLAWEWCGWSFQYDGMTLRCLLWLRVVQNDVLALVSWLVTTKYRGYVPGSVSLQVIRNGIQQLVIVVSFTRLLVLRCTYHFVFFHRDDIYGLYYDHWHNLMTNNVRTSSYHLPGVKNRHGHWVCWM